MKNRYIIILGVLVSLIVEPSFSYGQTATATIDTNTIVMPNPKLLLGITYDCRSSLSDPVSGLTGYHNTNGSFIAGIDSIFNDFPMSTLRYPANGIMQGFEWKKSIGPINLRVPQQIFASPSTPAQVMEFGFDEFMAMTAARGVSPKDIQIMVPIYDSADVTLTPTQAKAAIANVAQSNADWVEYCNAPNDGTNPGGGIDWAAVRDTNGHHLPYGIEIWNMGNEPYTSVEYGIGGVSNYINNIVPIIDAMLAIDSTIKITVTVLAKTMPGNWTDSVLNSPLLQGKIYGVNNHFFLTENVVGPNIPAGVSAAELKLSTVTAAAYAKGYKVIVGDNAPAIVPSSGNPTQAEQDLAMQWQGANLSADFLLMMSQTSNIERSDFWVYGSTFTQWHPIRKNANGTFTLMPTADLYKKLFPVFLDNSLGVISSSPIASDGNSYSVRSGAFVSSDKKMLNVVAVNRDKMVSHTLQVNGITGYNLLNAKILTATSLNSDSIIESPITANSSGFYLMPPMSVLILEYSNTITDIETNIIDVNNRLNIFPNPVDELLHFNKPIENFTIYNILGEEIITKSNATTSFSTNDLIDGIYFLKSSDETIKFIVKH